MIFLTATDLAIASLLVIVLAALSLSLQLGMTRTLFIAALRTVVQLLLIGFVLNALFAHSSLAWVSLMALIMLFVAGREVSARQAWRLKHRESLAIGTLSMFLTSFSITVLMLVTVIGVEPWYQPQYAIPLLGMMLGNTMNGVALSMDSVLRAARTQRTLIEERLALGMPWKVAVADIRRDSVRVGLTPIINAMAAAGLVSLPGMMTGQILAGTPPLEAVKYQILIMFMITSGTGLGTILAVQLAAKRLFDERDRLRLDRLEKA